MDHRYVHSRVCHPDLNLFLEKGSRLDGRLRNQPICSYRDFYRKVICGPSGNRILRRFPHAIAAAELELIFVTLSELFGKFLEHILPANKSKSNHSRSDVTSNNEVDFTVAHSVAVTQNPGQKG